jgi:hypothetical protein
VTALLTALTYRRGGEKREEKVKSALLHNETTELYL